MTRRTVSLRIDPKLWKDAKRKAAESDMSTSSVIEQAIINYFPKKKKGD